jgi:DNA-binding transcriptional LysR family regulator
MGIMDVRLLRYFVALAEECSFTAAARRLHLSQPALSQQMLLWERRLGTVLVDRSVHPLKLTPAGEHLLAGAYRLLRAHEDLEQGVRAIGSGRAGGELRIGFVYGGLYGLLVRALQALRAEHPGALLPTRQLGGDGQLAALRAVEVDVVLYRRTHPESLDGLASRHLFHDWLIAALPTGHPAGGSGRVRLADLAGEPFALLRRKEMPLVFHLCVQACRDAGFDPHPITEYDDPLSLALAVGSGDGIGLSGMGMANRYAGIDYLPVEPAASISQISAVWNPKSRNALLPPFLAAVQAALPAGVDSRASAALAVE